MKTTHLGRAAGAGGRREVRERHEEHRRRRRGHRSGRRRRRRRRRSSMAAAAAASAVYRFDAAAAGRGRRWCDQQLGHRLDTGDDLVSGLRLLLLLLLFYVVGVGAHARHDGAAHRS